MELSSSDEDDCQLEFWNNWSPLSELCVFDKDESEKNLAKKAVFKPLKVASIKLLAENSCFGNWIPPLKFLKTDSKKLKRIISLPSQKHIQKKKETLSANKAENIKEIQKILQKKKKYSNVIPWKKEINSDWGERVLLHDVSKYNDGELVWGIVNLGIFSNIKLWVNEYGNVSGVADGKISKITCLEMTYIYITDPQLLRKMLNLSSSQWTSLCETVQHTRATLKFNAFQDCDAMESSHLEKLWFFICKRRHFFPPQCMLVKLCGAVKCIRKFQIISKLVVQETRSILGEPIL